MKNLILTRCDSRIKNVIELSHPLIKEYAEFTNSDFCALEGDFPVITDDNLPHFRIMEVYDILNEYDRVMCIDTDTVIAKSIPNIFDVVPYENIGSIYEDIGSRQPHRRNIMNDVQNKFGDIGWSRGYINTGVFVISKEHREIFTTIDGGYWTGFGSDDVHLGYQINKKGFKVHELDFKWNHMTMFSEEWNNRANRFDSHIIHYAGAGLFDNSDKISQMKSDIQVIYQ